MYFEKPETAAARGGITHTERKRDYGKQNRRKRETPKAEGGSKDQTSSQAA